MNGIARAGLVAVMLSMPVKADESPPERIVCLAPNFVETLIELGMERKIVGVTTSSDYLDKVKHVERVGLYAGPNVEKIISLEPDLVLAPRFVGQKKAQNRLKELGVRVVVFESGGIDEIAAMVAGIGRILNAADRAKRLEDDMRRTIDAVRRSADTPARPRVYVEAGYDPLFTCGRGSFVHEMIEIAGGTNIAGDIDKPFPMISSEFVVSRNPEIIILPNMERRYSKDEVAGRNGWDGIAAVRNGRVFDDIAFNTLTIPSPNLILKGLPELFRRIHPEWKDASAPDAGMEEKSQ